MPPSPAGQNEPSSASLVTASYKKGEILRAGNQAFRLTRCLGLGAMGEVYEVEDQNLGVTRVMKLLRPELVHARPHLVDRFIRESRGLAKLRHPSVVPVLLSDRLADGTPFYVMEFVAGRSLAAFLAKHAPLEPRVALPILMQLASGLEAVHAAGIVHRDVKPDNVLVWRESAGIRATLLDFGVMKLLADDVHEGFCGTPKYAAPEQLMGELPTVKFDIFALGCVAYQMLTRHEPYEDFDSPLERVGRPAPRLAETGRAKRVSDDLAGLVADMLSLDPAQRPTARQVSDRLLQCRESQAQPASRLGDDEITNAELLSISPLHATPLLPADLGSHTMPGGPPMEIMEAARRALAPTVRGQSLEGLGRGFSESAVNVLAHTELAPESAVKQGSGEFDIAAQAMAMAQRAALRMAHTRSLTSSGMPAPNTARVVEGMLSPTPSTAEPTGPGSFAKGASKTMPLQSAHSVAPRTQSGTLPMQAAFSRDSVAPPPPVAGSAHGHAGHSAASALVRSSRPGSTPRETADAVAAARAAASEEQGRGGRALVAVVVGIVIALVILGVVGAFLRLHR